MSQLLGNFLILEISTQVNTLTHSNHKKKGILLCQGRRCPYNANYLWISSFIRVVAYVQFNSLQNISIMPFMLGTYWHHIHKDLLTNLLNLDTFPHILPKISSPMFLILIRLFILIERPQKSPKAVPLKF